MINKIKIRLSILILSLITIIGIMTISINGKVKKISNASEDYKEKLIRFIEEWIPKENAYFEKFNIGQGCITVDW